MTIIREMDELEALYGVPRASSLEKEVAVITDEYAAYIEASPFVAFATCGPEGIDCSPRGDVAGFIKIADRQTLLMPDRMGNNRIDSLRNIIRDPRASLMFLVPGSQTVMRVNGKAGISIDEKLLTSFAVDNKKPRSVVVLTVEAIYFQCARAVMRSGLWDAENFVDPKSLPSVGTMLSAITRGKIDAKTYDAEWPGRAKKSMW